MTWTDTEHIVSDPEIQGGALTIRGTRFPVETIHNWCHEGVLVDEFWENYPHMREYADAINAALAIPRAANEHLRPVGLIVSRDYLPGTVLVMWDGSMDYLAITEIDAHVEAYRAALYAARDAWEEVGR